VDRLAGDGGHTIATEMAKVDCKGCTELRYAIVAETFPKRHLN
jgi:hypothetical protein